MIAEEIDQIVGVQGPLSLQEELQLEDKRLQDFMNQHFRKQAVNQEEKKETIKSSDIIEEYNTCSFRVIRLL